ncbi:MAG: HD domain-containing protein [Bacteriovorax sp.]|nr:HD domain-containing protein [Bacteriovorax sp.]
MSKIPFKILIVDPDHNAFDFLNTQLIRFQLTILSSRNLVDAKKLIISDRPDLIIAEMYLPDGSGVDLFSWMEKNFPKAKSILVTSDVNVITNNTTYDHDLYELLVKPFPTTELDRVIKKIYPELLSIFEKEASRQKYMEISFNEFLVGTKALMSLYLKLSVTKFVKIVHKGEIIENALLEKYKKKGVRSIYVESEEYDSYLDLGLKASDIIKDKKNISIEKKTKFFIHVSDIFQEKLYKTSFNEDDFNDAQSFVVDTLEVAAKNKSVMDLMELLKNNSNVHYAHCLAVSIYSVLLAKKLQWSTDKTTGILAIGGFLHDIGKKNFPEELRTKPYSTFSEEELRLYENHTILGAEILTRIENIPKEVFQIIMQHHECIDGSGYPFGITNVNIFPLAKVVGLVNRFANLVLETEKGKAMTPKEAIKYIEYNEKEKFDSKMLEELKRLIIL